MNEVSVQGIASLLAQLLEIANPTTTQGPRSVPNQRCYYQRDTSGQQSNESVACFVCFRSGFHLRFSFPWRLTIWAATTVAATGFGWIGCAGEALAFSNKIGAHFRG